MQEQNEQVIEYLKTRSPEDINLIEEVRNIFISSGLASKLPIFNRHNFIINAEDKLPSVQRYYLNRYFHLQLTLVPNSFNARYNLITDGEFDYWIKLFKEFILPVLIEHNLPVSN